MTSTSTPSTSGAGKTGEPSDCVPYDEQEVIAYSDAAVRALHEECQQGLLGYVKTRLRGDDHAAEDIADQAWLELIKRWIEKKRLRAPEALLFQIATNRVTDTYRQRGVQLVPSSDNPELLAAAATAMLRIPEFETELITHIDLVRALRQLPERQAQAMVLHHGLGLTNEVTAALMGVEVFTVQNVLKSALTTLRRSPHLVGYRKETS